MAVVFSSMGALGGCNDGDEGIGVARAGAGGTAGASGAGGSIGGSSGAGSGGGGSGGTGGNATGGSATGGSAGTGGMTCTPVFLDAGVPPDTDAGADAGDGGPGDRGAGVSNGPVGFAADVYPILQANCGPCHTTDYSGGHNVASSDEAEAYGFAQMIGGRLLQRVNGGGMPPTCSGVPGDPGCLSAAEVDLIRRWTAQCFPP